ncbi:MAG: hypothetical protein WAM14_22735 [Candidatus Nitrosopolaris sp.]
MHYLLLVRGNFGNKGNYELVVPMANGNGFAQYFHPFTISDNDKPILPWNGPFVINAGIVKLSSALTTL